MKLAFYGDDFTGSTDALEVLAFAGLRAALVVGGATDARSLASLGPLDAVGLAGASRAWSPLEMDARLPPLLAALARLGAPLVHYKVCSTFDSAPSLGSIGRVMDLARASGHFADDVPLPIVAATPALGRYCAFGHLFARAGTDGLVHRLDRHPVMSVHPATPMHEADLARHLAAQTSMPIRKLTLPAFEGEDDVGAALSRGAQAAAAPGEALLVDGTTAAHLTATGRWLDACARDRHARPLFCVGPSGLEYALTQWWRACGAASGERPPEHFAGVPQLLAVSGSASPVSALQIEAALAAGFVDLPLDPAEAGDAALGARAVEALSTGRSVMLHSARGPHDPRLAPAPGGARSEDERRERGRRVSERLAALVERVLRQAPTGALPRLVVAGGDTSSAVVERLAPRALVVAARFAPGAPLCRLLADEPLLTGLEVALKGGQLGTTDYFVRALRGTAAG